MPKKAHHLQATRAALLVCGALSGAACSGGSTPPTSISDAQVSAPSADGGALPEAGVTTQLDGGALPANPDDPTAPARDAAVPTSDAASCADSGASPFSEAQLGAQHCDPSRPAFVYRAGLANVSEPGTAPSCVRAPVPCLTLTGIGSTEPGVEVAKDGTVFYAPAFTPEGVGVLRSRDHGASWQTILPKFPNGGGHGRVQPTLYMDPKTDRVFFATTAALGKDTSALTGFNLTYSSDLGETWQHSTLLGASVDWAKIYAGPAVGVQTQGYPNVLYASAPSPLSTPVPYAALLGIGPLDQRFQRSLDGGKTWQDIAALSIQAQNVTGCDPNEWVIYGSGTVTPDGIAYQVLRRCRELAIARSSDDGGKWTILPIPGASMPPFDTRQLTGIVQNPNVLATQLLTSDAAGNLYVVWVDAQGILRLTYSKDGALTWSKSVAIAAPDVKQVRYASVAAKAPGVIAVVYYGATDEKGMRYNGYIAESENAFDAQPNFWSVVVNKPDEPLFPWGFEVGYLGILTLADLNEIVEVRYAPNGDIWASFVKDMCKGAAAGDCTWDVKAHRDSVFQGVVGRAVHGVAPSWSPAPAQSPYREDQCELSKQPSENECKSMLTSEYQVCTDLASCMCKSCRCELYECYEDPSCTAVLVCAAKNNCRGQECLVFGCQDAVLKAGDYMTALALKAADCATANSCPSFCF